MLLNLLTSFSKTSTLCLRSIRKLRCQVLPIQEERTELFSRHLMPPDIAGIKLVLTISSSCFSWSVMCWIVPIKYVGFCLNLIIKHEYAACGPYHAILLNMHNSVSNGRFFLSCSFADTVICSSETATRYLLLSVVIFIWCVWRWI